MEKIIEEFKSRRAKRLDQRFGGDYQKVVEFRKRRAERLDAKNDDEEGRWVTTENNHKVHINEEGEPDKGNPHVIERMESGEKDRSFKRKSGTDYNDDLKNIWKQPESKQWKSFRSFLEELPDGSLLDCNGWRLMKTGKDTFLSGLSGSELDLDTITDEQGFGNEKHIPKVVETNGETLRRYKIKQSQKQIEDQENAFLQAKIGAESLDERIKEVQEKNEKLKADLEEEREYYLSDKFADLPYEKVLKQLEEKQKELDEIEEELKKYKDVRYGEVPDEVWEEKHKLVVKECDLEDEYDDIYDNKLIYDGWKEQEAKIAENEKTITELKDKKKKADEEFEESKEKLEKLKSDREKAIADYNEYASKRNKNTLKKFKSADDLKTAEDATDYLRAKGYFKGDALEVDENVSLHSMSPDLAVSTAQHIDSLFTDYPFLKGNMESVLCIGRREGFHRYEDRDAYAYADGKKVVFSREYYEGGEKLKADYGSDVKDYFHPDGVDHNSIVDHEFTHVMEKILNEKLNGRRASDIVAERVAVRRFGLDSPEDAWDYPEYFTLIRSSVSRYSVENYGTQVDENGNLKYKSYGENTEFLAEAISAARCSKNPDNTIRMAREEFDKLVKEVFG